MRCRSTWALWALAAMLFGCGQEPVAPVETEARATVRAFYGALLEQEWSQAYAVLHADSKVHLGPQEFARLAKNYRRRLGFEPEKVRVPSCSAQSEQALAQVVLVGRASGKERSFRDALTLRRSPAGWSIVLPKHFGR